MVINCLAWWNKFLMITVHLPVKISHQHPLDVSSGFFFLFFVDMTMMGFSTEIIAVWFLHYNSETRFCLLHFLAVKQNLTQMH